MIAFQDTINIVSNNKLGHEMAVKKTAKERVMMASVGAIGGAKAGAMVGALGGPVGVAVGAKIGAVAGGIRGAIDPEGAYNGAKIGHAFSSIFGK